LLKPTILIKYTYNSIFISASRSKSGSAFSIDKNPKICYYICYMLNYLFLLQIPPHIYKEMALKVFKISQKFAEKSVIFLLILALTWQFAFPRVTSLAQTLDPVALREMKQALMFEELGQLSRVITVPVTAYNSLPAQTDSTPCLTANGFDLCQNNQQNVIAANFLPFGAKVRFPDYDPDTIYTVQDRMNARYAYRADIWMKTIADARQFGVKNLKMEIYQ